MGIQKDIFNTGELQRSMLPILILQAIQDAVAEGRSWASDVRKQIETRLVDLCEQTLEPPIRPIPIHFSTVSLFLKEMEEQRLIETKEKAVFLTKLGRDQLKKWRKTFSQLSKGLEEGFGNG
jgi:hypothetical protein